MGSGSAESSSQTPSNTPKHARALKPSPKTIAKMKNMMKSHKPVALLHVTMIEVETVDSFAEGSLLKSATIPLQNK